MLREFLKSKIHRATITEASLDYEGSIAIDEKLLKEAGILPNEFVQIYNINTGDRFETYAIPAPENSRTIGLNGAAARLGQPGDKVIIVSKVWLNDDELANHKSIVLLMDDDNHIKKIEKK
ncbi:MAG: aspartate 1-decarboxylase [Calditrichia bacterium]